MDPRIQSAVDDGLSAAIQVSRRYVIGQTHEAHEAKFYTTLASNLEGPYENGFAALSRGVAVMIASLPRQELSDAYVRTCVRILLLELKERIEKRKRRR